MLHSSQFPNSVNVAITGSGGAGVITAGTMLLEAAAKAGWYGLFTRSSGPQIRGGEAAAMIRLEKQPVAAPGDSFDILIAIDWHNIERFASELPLTQDSLVIADPAQGEIPEVIAKSAARILEIPLKDLARKINKGRQNMIAFGAIAALIGLDEDVVDEVMERLLAKRGEQALIASRQAVVVGGQAISEAGLALAVQELPAEGSDRWLMSGNEAAGLGALRGGVRFVAAYPITPATELLEWMAHNLPTMGGALVQAEDELASINMIIGASYGGTPALTATSGPGLALMTESFGLAVAAEVPIIVVDVMRGGPSTGIPTKSEQTDLNIALFGLHGDAPHLVVAPNCVSDCVFSTQWAVSLAEATQTPAIVLSDQLLGQTKVIIDPPADLAFVSRRVTADDISEGYQRYGVSGSGVSSMAIPGTPHGQYTADGLEHDEEGHPSSQDKDHAAQLEKRSAKLDNYDFGSHWADIEGTGSLAVICWGSTTATVREALARLSGQGLDFRLISPRLLAPARLNEMARALKGVERVLTIELSHSAQFHHYLKGYFDISCPLQSHHRPGPLPFRVAEICDVITKWSAQ
ncbi:MAG: 2-oxoacid:acceptor oxidoreductase subunit alpha [Rhodospirillales bacterium]|nr:2-oxoacid:acceptor oxidoreductase subunit alpha [Rhodospirillales bacterium]